MTRAFAWVPVRYQREEHRVVRTFLDGLRADHHFVGEPCVACGNPFVTGQAVSLVYVGPGDDPEEQHKAARGKWHTGVAVMLHSPCAGILPERASNVMNLDRQNRVPCKSCRAPVVWAFTEKNKRTPMNPDAVPDGNCEVRSFNENMPVVHVLTKEELSVPTGPRYKSHYATCPDSDSWRKN